MRTRNLGAQHPVPWDPKLHDLRPRIPEPEIPELGTQDPELRTLDSGPQNLRRSWTEEIFVKKIILNPQ